MHIVSSASMSTSRSGRCSAVRDRIVAAVAQDFALGSAEVMAPTRRAPRVALARQVAMYLAHVGCGLDFVTVGRLFRRDRTTVSHACRVIEDRRDDAGFDRRMAALEAACCVPPEVVAGARGGRR